MVVDPTSSSRVVVVTDYYGRYLSYSNDKGIHFSAKCQKMILRRTEAGMVLALRENPAMVLIHKDNEVALERNPFDLAKASIVLYCNLQKFYAIQFSSENRFMANSHGKCIASEDPLSRNKTSKLFRFQVLLDSSPMKWPTRANLQGTRSNLYLENSSGQVILAAAAKCCTEEFILEVPSVYASSSSEWKGCLWYGDGAHVVTNSTCLSLTSQHACFGKEEFVYNHEGKNTLSFCTLEQTMQKTINVNSERRFLMEICSKPCAIVSVYGDVLVPFPFSDQVPSSRIKSVHISAEKPRKLNSVCSSWIFRHHGDCIYSIEDSATGQNLILSPLGCLAFSVDQEDKYPNQIALFEVEMVCIRLPQANKVGEGNTFVTGFRIACVQKYKGCKMTLNALPDGSIRLLESSKVPCPDEIFAIADSKTAQESIYLQGTIFDPNRDVMRKSKSHAEFGSQDKHLVVRPSRSCDNIVAKIRETNKDQNKWGIISAARAETYLEEFIAGLVANHDLRSATDVDTILKNLLPPGSAPCAEYTVLYDILSKQCRINSAILPSSKISCAEIMDSKLDEQADQGIMQTAATLDDDEREETFLCTACDGETGLLKPLHPEINPQHHLYLKTMLRLQFGGARTRRRRFPTGIQSNIEGNTLWKKCILLGACAFMAYKKVTST